MERSQGEVKQGNGEGGTSVGPDEKRPVDEGKVFRSQTHVGPYELANCCDII